MNRDDHLTQAGPMDSFQGRGILWIAVTALIYFAVARVSLSFTFEPEGIAAIWPPAGIFLSAVLLTRRSIRPYLVAALFFTDLVAEVLAGTPLVVSLVYSAALAGDAVLGAWLLRRFVGEQLTFHQVRHVIGFLLLSVLLSNALMSVVAALAAAVYLRVPFWSSWLWWWSSDGVGSLLVTPLIMSLAFAVKSGFAEFKKRQFIEGAVLFFLTAFVNSFAFSHFLEDSWFILLLNLLTFPFLIWAAFRFGVIGAATTSAILAAIILQYAIAGSFAHFDVNSNLLAIILVQVYIAMAAIPTILLAALITERKQAEEELKEGERRLDTLTQASFEGIALTKQGLIVDLNDQMAQMLGYRREELLNIPVRNCVAPEHREAVAEFMASGRLELYEHLALRKDGTSFPVEIRARITRIGGQEMRVTAVRDITERKRTEAALRESLERFQLANRATFNVIWDWSLQADTLWWNENLQTIFGYRPEEVEPGVESWTHRIHPQDLQRVKAGLDAAIDSGGPYWIDRYRFRRKDGQYAEIEDRGSISRDESGKAIRMIGAMEDVTKRNRTEAALRESEQLYRYLFENMLNGFAYCRMFFEDGKPQDFMYLVVNEAFETLTGLKNVAGRRVSEVIPGIRETDQQLFEVYGRVAMTGQPERFEFYVQALQMWFWISVYSPAREHFVAVFDVITERKRAEEALRERNNYIETILENAPIGFAVNTIHDGKVVFVGSKFEEIYGVPRGSMNAVDGYFEKVYLDPVFREQIRERVMADIATGDASCMRWENIPITTIKGEHKIVTAINIPLLDRDLMVSTVQDVTERWRAQEGLRESEERLRLALAAVNQGMYDLDVQTGEVTVSPEYATMLGYDPATFRESNALLAERMHPDDRDRVMTTYHAYVNGELPAYAVEFRLRTQSGVWKWILSVGKIVARDGQGRPLRMLGTHTDITERKRAERLLQSLNAAALAMQRALVPNEVFAAAADELGKNGCTCAIFATDQDQRRLNLKYNSYPPSIVRFGEGLLRVKAENFSLPVEPVTAIQQAIRDKQSVFVDKLEDALRQQLPEPYQRLAGPLVKILDLPNLIITPLMVEDEVVGALFVLSNDLLASDVPAITAFGHQMAAAWRKSELFDQARQEIAARKQAEDQVRRLNAELEQRVVERTAQLEEANKELEAFAYSVSHDLRAPLRAIDGYTRLLVEDHAASLNAEETRVCAVIRENTRRMGQLIDDLLAFSRLSRADMQSSVIEMEPMVRSVYQEVMPPVDRERIDFRVEKLPTALGDRRLMLQVWINLVSNAIKFSSKRERAVIQVGCQQTDSETVYFVRDNGAGFDMQYGHKLFGVFQRLHSEREFEGTGVGLAIVQRVIQRHGGRVWAEGAVNQGATFYFALPRNGGRP